MPQHFCANYRNVVYFMISGNRKIVKIGRTFNLKKRMYDYTKMEQIYSGYLMSKTGGAGECIGWLECPDEQFEYDLHKRFAAYAIDDRKNNEWFYLKPELVNFILSETFPFEGYNSYGQPFKRKSPTPTPRADNAAA